MRQICIINLLVFGIGLAAGLYNLYQMGSDFLNDAIALFS